jgi:integrase
MYHAPWPKENATREEIDKVIAACPCEELKLILALSRYGGLRCPSEHLALTWGDINWEQGRITVKSPKTAHHEGHDSRVIPLFAELEPYLQAALDALLEDFDPKANRLSEQHVIRRYRTTNANLRTQVMRIIKRAGLVPWSKLFMNMRSSRATELAAEHPGHVAANWLGHSTMVAQKHYWQTTDADFDRALYKCAQQSSVIECNDPQEPNNEAEELAESLVFAGKEYTPQESNL